MITFFFLICVLVSVTIASPVTGEKRFVQLDQQEGGDIRYSNTRNGILKGRRWPNGIVYYDYGYKWGNNHLIMISEAMRAIEKSTCIKFVRRTNEKPFLNITNTPDGCFTDGVGIDASKLSLMDQEEGQSCFAEGTIKHELMHVVGLWHEQQRHDRDDHLIIHWENVLNTTASMRQLSKIPKEMSDTYGIPYNYRSMMHYGAKAYSKNDKVTMEPRVAGFTDIIGNSQDWDHELDYEKVRRMYECKGSYTPITVHTTKTYVLHACKDKYATCNQYLDKCGKEDWLTIYCPLSCKMCTPTNTTPMPGPCQDTRQDCNANLDKCGKESWMLTSCRRSCGLCL